MRTVYLGDLEGPDRTIAKVNIVVVVLLLVGLAVTGLWLFLFHDPTWDDFVVGSGRPIDPEPSPMADAHGAFADLAAGVALWITIWLSYRVLAKIAWSGVVAMVVTASAIVGGGFLRIDAIVRDGVADPTATGYVEVLRGDYDFVVSGGRDFGPGMARVLTLLHIAGWPLVVAAIGVPALRASRRRRNARPADPAWLDRVRP